MIGDSDIISTRTTMNVAYWATPGKVVATTQRVASASMAEAFGPAGARPEVRKISRGGARELKDFYGYEILLWVREPFDRAACAYAIWNHPPHKVMSPNTFAEKILAEQNPHFSPQLKLHMAGENLLPTKLFAFEDLAKTWAAELPDYPLPHVGAQPNRINANEFIALLDPMLYSKLLSHYEQDVAAHMLAREYGCYRTPDLVEIPCGAA